MIAFAPASSTIFAVRLASPMVMPPSLPTSRESSLHHIAKSDHGRTYCAHDLKQNAHAILEGRRIRRYAC